MSFNISANLINKKVTAFSWIVDSSDPYRGKCYEYDIETGGKAFQAVTRKSKCRPKSVDYLWVPNDKGIGGKCYEVDSKTKGTLYSSTSSIEKCVTENVKYQWKQTSEMSGECFEIDGDLRRVVSKSKCAPKNIDHHWIPSKSGWGGKCYAVDSLSGPSGYIESVNSDRCKPEETVFILNLKREGEQGYCFEVSAHGGAKVFSKRASRESCFTSSTPEYSWKRDPSGIGGECLEIRKSIHSKVSSRKVNYKKCINFKTRILFKRTSSFAGLCLIVDDLTNGEVFSKNLVKRNCREEVEEIELSLVPNEYGKPICVERDMESQGEKYVGKVSLRKCEESGAKPRWVLGDDGWSGRCVINKVLGDSVREAPVHYEKCRPKEVRTLWHNFSKLNGKCFDIDKKLGTIGYVKEVESKKCAPKFKKYIFYREEGKSAGNCYQVDRETSGAKYNKKVGTRKCRENLIKVPKD